MENKIQRDAEKYLTQAKFTFISTANRRRSENTPGTPDLFVNIVAHYWIGIELKTEDKKSVLSKEQKTLYELGKTFVCRTAIDVIETAVRERERLIGRLPKNKPPVEISGGSKINVDIDKELIGKKRTSIADDPAVGNDYPQ